MPKRLSELTYSYRCTADRLERAQDQMTEHARTDATEVADRRNEHLVNLDALLKWFRANPGRTLVSANKCYHLEYSSTIVETATAWAHEIELPDELEPQPATYRMPTGRPSNVHAAMATAWDDVEPNDEPATAEMSIFNPED